MPRKAAAITNNSAIFHAFEAPFAGIAAAAPRIAANGFTAVLLPPPLFSAEDGVIWWNRYQPSLTSRREMDRATAR